LLWYFFCCWVAQAFWDKEKTEMAAEDITLIEKAASLSIHVDSHWAQMREVYEGHPVLRMAEDFQHKEQTQTAGQAAPADADKPRR